MLKLRREVTAVSLIGNFFVNSAPGSGWGGFWVESWFISTTSKMTLTASQSVVVIMSLSKGNALAIILYTLYNGPYMYKSGKIQRNGRLLR